MPMIRGSRVSSESDISLNAADRDTRRDFLRRSATTAAAAGTLLSTSSLVQTASARTPPAPAFPQLYSGQNKQFFDQILKDENTHVSFLINSLGANARPKPIFQNLRANSLEEFIQMAVAFENTGASAYVTAGIFIDNILYQSAGLRIGGVEAYHSGYLNALANQTLTPGASSFVPQTATSTIVTALEPYITNLNGGPPATYDEGRSPDNDIAILNFALLLEYLEQTFYTINVPIYFS